MRKRTINCLFDNIFWFFVYLLPLILLVAISVQTGSFVSLSTALDSVGLNVLTNNVIFSSLSDIFGTNGILPLFQNVDILCYLTYFISCMLLHLFVDIILVLPRYAMNLFDGFLGGKRND